MEVDKKANALKTSELAVKGLFLDNGIKITDEDTELKETLQNIISEDCDKSVKLANNFITLLNKTKEIEYTLIGMAYYLQDKLDDAVEYFNLAIDANDNYDKAYEGRNQAMLENHLKIIDLPERADYFSDPGKLIFNWHYPVNVHYEHILDDLNTAQRLPERIRTSDLALETLKGVIDSSIQKVTANYKLAIPHYYNNRIQLMIPLYFNKNNIPDVALVLNEIDGKCYQARTCLSMKMAYIDARIISKPDVFWLSFDTINAREEK